MTPHVSASCIHLRLLAILMHFDMPGHFEHLKYVASRVNVRASILDT